MKKLQETLVTLLCLHLICLSTVYSKDFGKLANTFEIKEEGFVSMIQRKLKAVDIEKENRKMERLAKERVENPPAVTFIKKATARRTFYFDPTYILQEDIKLPNGSVMIPKGTEVNPLDHMSLNRKMFFVDGSDIEQMDWLKKQISELLIKNKDSKKITKETEEEVSSTEETEIRIILVKGRIFDIKKELKEISELLESQVYFDQAGELTGKFKIKAVPALAYQEGRKIRIEEIDIEGEEG